MYMNRDKPYEIHYLNSGSFAGLRMKRLDANYGYITGNPDDSFTPNEHLQPKIGLLQVAVGGSQRNKAHTLTDQLMSQHKKGFDVWGFLDNNKGSCVINEVTLNAYALLLLNSIGRTEEAYKIAEEFHKSWKVRFRELESPRAVGHNRWVTNRGSYFPSAVALCKMGYTNLADEICTRIEETNGVNRYASWSKSTEHYDLSYNQVLAHRLWNIIARSCFPDRLQDAYQYLEDTLNRIKYNHQAHLLEEKGVFLDKQAMIIDYQVLALKAMVFTGMYDEGCEMAGEILKGYYDPESGLLAVHKIDKLRNMINGSAAETKEKASRKTQPRVSVEPTVDFLLMVKFLQNPPSLGIMKPNEIVPDASKKALMSDIPLLNP